MKVSIVIPTYGDRAYDLLKPCLESIRQYTDLSDTEAIIVANGCTDLTRQVGSMFPEFRMIWHDEPLGYTKACNAGMKVANGDYIILLNNDIVLLEQPKNLWIDILLRAFWDERCAIAGPMMQWCPWAEYDFLIGFCTMFRRSAIEELGYYDEIFEAYGEDCDVCVRAIQKGYRIAQVPDSEIRRSGDNPNIGIGNFPLYHAGNQTYANWPGGEELLRKNRAILRERYGTNIGKAHDLDGWMSNAELRWLAERARNSKVFVQIGAWHGKSSRAIADNLPPDGKLYDIDAWVGSNAELDTNHWSARLMEGDHAFNEYARGMWDHLASGKVTPLKMRSHNGAALLMDMGIKADTIFIDGGHGPGETRADIEAFLPLRKEGGIISGHDYMHIDGMWPDVGPEVKEVFGKYVGNPERTSIWYTDATPIPQKPNIYDCFIFNNEVDILKRRLESLFDTVDRFVIVEATKTHSGKEKELVFRPELIGELSNKVTYIVVNDMPEVEGTVTDKSWARERHQRDAIMRGLAQCKDNDIIIISDCDEIPSPSAIQSYDGSNELRSFDMDLFYYNHETKAQQRWRDSKILPYGLLKKYSPCWARYKEAEPIPDGGEHLSYFGGIDSIIRKLENTAHVEYDNPHYKDPERIKKAIENHTDLFDRDYVKFQ
jgi:beta-1,4-mannosyl-glycoprotein beta-1,4-N-acetylglucosaminyltransferase